MSDPTSPVFILRRKVRIAAGAKLSASPVMILQEPYERCSKRGLACEYIPVGEHDNELRRLLPNSNVKGIQPGPTDSLGERLFYRQPRPGLGCKELASVWTSPSILGLNQFTWPIPVAFQQHSVPDSSGVLSRKRNERPAIIIGRHPTPRYGVNICAFKKSASTKNGAKGFCRFSAAAACSGNLSGTAVSGNQTHKHSAAAVSGILQQQIGTLQRQSGNVTISAANVQRSSGSPAHGFGGKNVQK
ncbi:hypothetical protein B0H13DRAFT_1882065 [Mycena leptocephala]|nr:hypothetical protein B0H13DRAFT_1882065 [Mycena leptocephala]